MKRFWSDRKGFSLVELMIVLVVMGILVAIAIPSFRGMRDEAGVTEAEGEMQTLKLAIESYYRGNDKFPTKLTELYSARPNIVSSELDDPFTTDGNTYGYNAKIGTDGADHPVWVLYSYGPDGKGAVPTVKNSGKINVYVSVKNSGDTADDIVVSNVPVRKE